MAKVYSKLKKEMAFPIKDGKPVYIKPENNEVEDDVLKKLEKDVAFKDMVKKEVFILNGLPENKNAKKAGKIIEDAENDALEIMQKAEDKAAKLEADALAKLEKAQADADKIIADANAKADKIKADAEAKAKKVNPEG